MAVPILWLNEKTSLPVENLYETPRTLGYDRMAAVVGATEQFPGRDILVIDAGTCITYESVSYTHLDVYKRQGRGNAVNTDGGTDGFSLPSSSQ